MIDKCPGSQKFSRPYPEFIRCLHCRGEVEIWSDEVKAVCPKCKKEIVRTAGGSCLDWCRYAKECVGDEAYSRFLRNKRERERKK